MDISVLVVAPADRRGVRAQDVVPADDGTAVVTQFPGYEDGGAVAGLPVPPVRVVHPVAGRGAPRPPGGQGVAGLEFDGPSAAPVDPVAADVGAGGAVHADGDVPGVFDGVPLDQGVGVPVPGDLVQAVVHGDAPGAAGHDVPTDRGRGVVVHLHPGVVFECARKGPQCTG